MISARTATLDPAARAFLEREIAAATCLAPVTRHAEGDGFTRNGRRYIPVRCHCGLAACAGWIMVHDHPADLAHFDKLFGPEAPRPAPRPPICPPLTAHAVRWALAASGA